MKLAVIQMSDLHITSGTDYIVEKSRNLARATASILNECSKVAVVVTGDIVDKGNVANYQFAKKMFQDFRNEIEKETKFDSWEYVFVPGNHDLDFGMDVPFRDFVLKDVLDNGGFKRNEYENEALKPQYEFWKFYDELSGEEHQKRISYEKQITINNNSSLIFHCYNTALLSTINEQPQSLIVPEANFITNNDDNGRNDIVISVFHHKTGWLATRGTKNNNHLFSEHIQKQSQILMCGHEHQHRGKQISDLDNRDAILYLENDSLQQGEEQSFSVLVLDDTDLTNAVLYTISIDAKKDVCLPIAEKNVPITYHGHSFDFTEHFYTYLHSLDAPIKHPRKDPLSLDDK